jgi:hypothetical protein
MLGLFIAAAGRTVVLERPFEGQQSLAHNNRQPQFFSPREIGLLALPLGLPLKKLL